MAIEDTMDTLTMDLAMDTGEEKGDLLNLNQSPKLSLMQTHGTDTMDMAMDTTDMDTTDTHIVDTTGVNKYQQNKELLPDIVKSKITASNAKTNIQRRPLQPQWTCLCPQSALRVARWPDRHRRQRAFPLPRVHVPPIFLGYGGRRHPRGLLQRHHEVRHRHP